MRALAGACAVPWSEQRAPPSRATRSALPSPSFPSPRRRRTLGSATWRNHFFILFLFCLFPNPCRCRLTRASATWRCGAGWWSPAKWTAASPSPAPPSPTYAARQVPGSRRAGRQMCWGKGPGPRRGVAPSCSRPSRWPSCPHAHAPTRMPSSLQGLRILARVNSNSGQLWFFLSAFDPRVWVALVLTSLAVGVAVWLAELATHNVDPRAEVLSAFCWDSVGRPTQVSQLIKQARGHVALEEAAGGVAGAACARQVGARASPPPLNGASPLLCAPLPRHATSFASPTLHPSWLWPTRCSPSSCEHASGALQRAAAVAPDGFGLAPRPACWSLRASCRVPCDCAHHVPSRRSPPGCSMSLYTASMARWALRPASWRRLRCRSRHAPSLAARLARYSTCSCAGMPPFQPLPSLASFPPCAAS